MLTIIEIITNNGDGVKVCNEGYIYIYTMYKVAHYFMYCHITYILYYMKSTNSQKLWRMHLLLHLVKKSQQRFGRGRFGHGMHPRLFSPQNIFRVDVLAISYFF